MTAPDETTQLFFTFAELEFLLGGASSWQRVRDAWGLPTPSCPDEAAAAGLASLVVRAMASRQGDELVLRDDVAGAKGLLTAATGWLRIAQLSDNGVEFAGNLGVGDPGDGHVVVAPVGSGCFEVVAVRGDGSAAEAVAGVVTGALARMGSGSVAVSGSGEDAAVITVSLDDDRWSVATESQADAFTTRDETNAALAHLLHGVLEVTV